MQEKTNSLSKFSPFSHIGQKRNRAFGKRVETKSLRSTALGIFVTSPKASASDRNSSVKTPGLAPVCKSSWTDTGKGSARSGKAGDPGRGHSGTPAGRASGSLLVVRVSGACEGDAA